MIDNLPPEAGLPLAALLWAIVALPHVARWNRARRAARKETCASRPTAV
ncbi:hypothetical protein SEA_GRETCHEN_52 [Microbacterium phage Gretchen]|nr:hypothetical protein SEA_GRETCHEN_52 [Microbacterium phage Gretchen]